MGGNMGARPWYLDLQAEAWQAYGSATHVTVDLETTTTEKGDPRAPENRLVTAAVQVNGGPIQDGLDSLRVLSELDGPVILVAHNAKFELAWLEREGFDTTDFLPWDTMIAEFVLAGNRRWELGLNATAKRYGLSPKGRLVDALISGGVCPSVIPETWLRERVRGDVAQTTALFYAQRARIEEDGLLPVMFTRCITTPVLARIEGHGLNLDPQRVAEMYEQTAREEAELEARLAELTGGINLNSPKQSAEFIYGTLGFKELTNRRGEPLRTKSGLPKTDQDTLDALVPRTAKQKKFVALRQAYGAAHASLTKNLQFFLGVCEEREGKFYGTFNQTVARTHRLSSSGKPLKFARWPKPKSVQLQNMPRTMKKLFCASGPDRVIAESDGAQLEFRVAGGLANDPQVLHDVTHNEDVHRFTASVLNNIPESEVTSEQRTAAKSDTFKPLYGGQYGTKAQMAYYEAFRSKYDAIYRMQNQWVYTVLREKSLRTATGLVFYWPDTRMSEGGYVTNTPSIFNYPIQSLATADIIPVSLVYLYWEVKARGIDAILQNTVHDSVMADVAKKDLDRYREAVIDCFLDRTYRYLDKVYGLRLSVPLGVGFKAGAHWGEGEEQKFSEPYEALAA